MRRITDPARYDGRLIKVAGYLVRVFGSAALYPNEFSYSGGAQTEGVELIDADLPEEIEKSLDDGITVTVIGVFDGQRTGTDALPMLGAIRDVRPVY